MTIKKIRCVVILAVLCAAMFGGIQQARAQCYLGTHDDVICPRNGANNSNATTGGSGPVVRVIDPGQVTGAYIKTPSTWNPVVYNPPIINFPPVPDLPLVPYLPIVLQPVPCVPVTPTDPGTQMTGGCAEFAAAMRQSENSGKYAGVNSIGCVGAYQFCPGTFERYYSGSKESFEADPAAQDDAFMRFTKDNWDTLKAHGACSKVGQTIDGVTVTPAALVGASHLGGAGGTQHWMDSGGTYNPDDGATKISQYAQKFGGFDLSSCGISCP